MYRIAATFSYYSKEIKSLCLVQQVYQNKCKNKCKHKRLLGKNGLIGCGWWPSTNRPNISSMSNRHRAKRRGGSHTLHANSTLNKISKKLTLFDLAHFRSQWAEAWTRHGCLTVINSFPEVTYFQLETHSVLKVRHEVYSSKLHTFYNCKFCIELHS